MLEEHKAEIGDLLFISKLTEIETGKFINRALTLENNRLPLETTFLLALSSHCVSHQVEQGPHVLEFCKNFAFYCTRWDTNLLFNGLGFEYTNEKSEKFKSIVYSFTVEIPILEATTLPLYKTINLGVFEGPNKLRRTTVAENAVLAKNGILHPINKNYCENIAGELICPPHAISPYDDCLHQIFEGKPSVSCITAHSATQTNCVESIQQSFVVISMSNNSTVHFDVSKNRHLHATEIVDTFDVIARRDVPGQIQCEKSLNQNYLPTLNIPALPLEIMQNISIKIIQGEKLVINHAHTNEIENISKLAKNSLDQIDEQKLDLKNQLAHVHEKLNSTFSYVKLTAKNAETTVLEKMKNFIIPYLLGAAGIILVFMCMWILVCCLFGKIKAKISKNEPRPFYRTQRSNRTTNL